MTAFVLAAALLAIATITLVGGSLARRPRDRRADADEVNAAVYRDQLAELDRQLAEGALGAEHHERAREAVRLRLAQELRGGAATRLGADRRMAMGIAAALAAGSAILYALIGTPAAIDPKPGAPESASAHGLQSEQILAMVQRLAARLREDPEDLNGWVMLARSQSALGRFDEAARAYEQAVKRAPREAALIADQADVLAMAQGRSFRGEPDRLIARALELDPSHIKALALAGSSAFARQDYARAVEHWKRIEAQVAPDSQMGRQIEASIAQARQQAAEKPSITATRPAPARAGDGRIAGKVTIAAALASRVKPGDTLFVFARPVSGARMPIAIVRQPVGAWPASFTLDDSAAMATTKLSTLREVVLEARISRTGSANPAPGDLRGVVASAKVGSTGAMIVVDSVVE